MTEPLMAAAALLSVAAAYQRPPAVSVFYCCDLVTGQIVADLPLGSDGKIRRIVGREEQATFTLAWADPQCPVDWAEVILPGKSMVVQTLDDEPVQAWAVVESDVGADTVPITAVTLEHCLARTNVGDVDFYGDEVAGAALVLEPLVERYGFTIEHTANGRVAETFTDSLEDRSLLAFLNDLMAAEGGPEWRTFVRWADPNTRQAFEKVVEVVPHLGIDRPDAIFDLDENGRGCVVTYRRNRSYADGKGATRLIGTSEGSGSSRPMTDPLTSPLVEAGWPTWESRVNFAGLDAPTIDDEDAELARRTREALTQREYGTVVWSITGDENAPRPGSDFVEGDTVHIEIAPQGQRDPIGGTAAVRVQGWDYDIASAQVTPILWEDR